MLNELRQPIHTITNECMSIITKSVDTESLSYGIQTAVSAQNSLLSTVAKLGNQECEILTDGLEGCKLLHSIFLQ